jgi:hypothetical protein
MTPDQRLAALNPSRLEARLENLPGIGYVVAPEGVILAYGRRAWEAFARANGCPELADPARVLGRSIYDFVTGDNVRASLRDSIATALDAGGTSVTYEYRCDAPHERRRMRMTLSPLPDQGEPLAVLFHSEVLSREARVPVQFLQAGTVRENHWPILTVCSYCNQVRFPAGAPAGDWLSAEDYRRRGGSDEVRLSHGICPPCFQRIIFPLRATAAS